MSPDFTRSLESVLRDLKRIEPGSVDATTSKQVLDAAGQHRREWFARFASERLMPLLGHTVEAIEKAGGSANCRLNDTGEALRR